MPAIASSRDELVAALKLAGLKKPKPQQVDRAWSALASGENRGAATGAYRYAGGVALAARLVVAGALRNPDSVAVLAAALAAAVVLFSRRRGSRRSLGCRAGGNLDGGGGGDDTAARGGGETANGSSVGTHAAGPLRPGSRGKAGLGFAGRGASSLSPRRLAGS